MFRKKICPRCETGKYTYELDPHSPECPYLSCHNGKKCTMYKELGEPEKHGFFSRILETISVTPPPEKMSL